MTKLLAENPIFDSAHGEENALFFQSMSTGPSSLLVDG